MSSFKSYQFYDFSGGLDYKNTAPLVAQSEKGTAWADGVNVELLNGNGIIKMNGSQAYATMPSNIKDEIIGGFQGEKNGVKYLVIVTKSGNFYAYSNSSFVLKKSGLTNNAKPNFKTYLNGLFISNGVDEPFVYMPDNETEILSTSCTTAGGHAIRGRAIEVYKGRMWIADGSTIYYSALGKYNDWTSENDAGSISNFHNDTSPVTALCCYKDVLVIHKADCSFILSGNSPSNFTIQPFSNLGAVSPFGINTANGRHVFYNGHIYPFLVNDLGEIVQGSAISSILENKMKEFDTSKNNSCIFLNYKSKSQLWCFLYKTSENYIHNILVYDYINNAWFLRVVPYDISSAWEYDDMIYSATKDGVVVKEAVGSSFLGEAVKFSWSSPFFHFGQVNQNKTVEELELIFDTKKDNNFNLQIKKDYSDYEIYDKTSFSNINSNTLVFCDENGNSGQGVLNGNTAATQYGYVTLPAQKVDNYTANITGANRAIQIQIYGNALNNSLSLTGLEFKDVYFDV